MKLVFLISVAVAIVALAPSAAPAGASYSTLPRPLTASHASNQPDTVPPVVETWQIWGEFYPVMWIGAELGVSDNTSDSYRARVKLKFHGADSTRLGQRFQCKPITDSRQAISIGAKRRWLCSFLTE